MERLYIFFATISIFHTSEYLLAKKYHPNSCGRSSWLITWPYLVAMSVGLLEYWVFFERHPLQSLFWQYFGLALIVGGEVIRKTSIVTLKSNFTHTIVTKKNPKHSLCTEQIYSIMRHPSYVGFFLWAVGTQVLLGNAASTLLFIVVLWRFMRHRIQIEDRILENFFGQDWTRYKINVRSGIPFIE